MLEGVCAFEVAQVGLGLAQGSFAMGALLHYTRLLIAGVVFPALPLTALAPKLVLLAWGLTEVCRYPMFLFPTSKIARRNACMHGCIYIHIV